MTVGKKFEMQLVGLAQLQEDLKPATVELAYESPTFGPKRACDTFRQRGIIISVDRVR